MGASNQHMLFKVRDTTCFYWAASVTSSLCSSALLIMLGIGGPGLVGVGWLFAAVSAVLGFQMFVGVIIKT